MKNKQVRTSQILRTIVLFVSLVLSFPVFGHSNDAQGDPLQPEDKVYKRVDIMPSYPGGTEAILAFIAENIQYPKDALEAGKQGTVVCEFVINKDGRFSDIRVVRGLSPSLDKEAIRVIKSFPKWEPGKNEGKVVRVLYTLPINFRIR